MRKDILSTEERKMKRTAIDKAICPHCGHEETYEWDCFIAGGWCGADWPQETCEKCGGEYYLSVGATSYEVATAITTEEF